MSASNDSVQTASQQHSVINSQDVSPKPRLLWVIVLISFVALLLLMISSGKQNALALDDDKMKVMQNAKVEVTRINVQNSYQKPRSVYGQVESASQSDIGFELGGTLARIVAVEGDEVKQGELLATLDTARLEARKGELQSNLVNAQANARLAKLSERRIAELVKKRLEPQQNLDEAQAQLDAANALTAEVTARLNSLEVDIQKAELKAPFDGQIIRQIFDSGTVVNAGQAVFSILAKTNLEARFGLPERTAFGIQAGSTYMLEVQGSLFPAKATSVAKQRNAATRTVDAIFTIDVNDLSPEQQQLIIAGDLVSLSVDLQQNLRGAWLPISALSTGVRGMWTLYVVSEQNQVEKRLVSIAFANENKAYVNGAITDNDKVVINGIQRLSLGQTLNNVKEVEVQ